MGNAKLIRFSGSLTVILADEVWFARITPGGQMQWLANKVADRRVSCSGKPVSAPPR